MTNPIYIRPIDILDALIVMNWENNPANWDASDNKGEYQLFDIVRMIEENCDSTTDKQLGTVDLFDIDFDKKEGFVGVLIAEKGNRQKGLASLAIEMVESEGFKLGLERLKCVVHPGNIASVRLFEKREFVKIGETDRQFLNEGVYLEATIYEKWVKK
jgi:diamine N-acetyltransferase